MKSIFRVIVFGVFLLFLPCTVSKASENGVGISDNKNGTVTVTYSNTNKNKIAVTVKKEGENTQYNYFMTNSSIETEIPLTAGNGTYKVSVLKNIQDTRYSQLSSLDVDLKLKDTKKAYLTSNQMITWNRKNSAIKKANKLTKKYSSQTTKIKVLYKYLVTKFDYDYNKFSKNANGSLSYYTPDIDETYASKKGICYDMSALTASMMRSVGVQTKMVTGYPRSQYYNGSQYHAWNRVYSKKDRKWMVLDVTCDMCLFDQGVKFKKLSMKKKPSQYSNIKYIW
ncbi:MAG: transglutaminase domain-containing protein [Lachnospiraceae bacterium]|nr:transglutaminase domain-containing protein [Lachnospiraceae bacterium]